MQEQEKKELTEKEKRDRLKIMANMMRINDVDFITRIAYRLLKREEERMGYKYE